MTKTLDVICLGRAAVDLYGQQIGGRLEDMQSFAKYLGGSSANLAAGLARLGTKSSMLTRVGNEQMGRFVREALHREGVDVGHVKTDPSRLTALVILGISDRNHFPHIFFRENCADMGVSVEDFDSQYIASSRALSITGTHLSTDSTFAAVSQAIDFANKNGTKVILDIDYRPVLWGLTTAGSGDNRFVASGKVTERIQSLIGSCDLLVGTEEEIHIAGGSTDTLAALRTIRDKAEATIVLKRGPLGCSVFEGRIPASVEQGISIRGVEVEVLNTLGAGDAFLSGFLHAWLDGSDWETCARYGNACGALVVSRHGCTPAMPTKLELEDYLKRANDVTRPDKDARIGYLHRSTARRPAPAQLFVLAFDHRRQLEELVSSLEPATARISAFKSLVCEAVLKVAESDVDASQLGIIVDARYGESVLSRMTAKNWWIGRPVEVPGSRPVEFDPRNSMGLPMLTWPASHIAKCLVFYHPADDLELRLQQEKRIRSLYADCAALDRDLLIEIIATANGHACDDSTVANVMRRFYNLGIYPTWWKLASQSSAGWQNISDVIGSYDPLCHGVIMLGLDAPKDELRESFQRAAPFDVCKGFAVGRSIFGEAARKWFNGEMNDNGVIDLVADNYRSMIRFWQEATADTKRGGARALSGTRKR